MPTTGFDIKRLLGAGLIIVSLGAGVSACGGGDSDEDPVATTATTGVTEVAAIATEDLISEGDAICAEVNAAIGSIDASTADDTTKSSQRSDIYDGLADRLAALGTPTDGDPPTDVIAAAQDLADGSTDVTALQTAASEYGFVDCAEAPEIPVVSSGTDTGTESSTGTDSTETYVPPTTTPEETYVPPTTTPPAGGGVAPPAPDTGGGTSSGSGGTSSGGIGPG